MLSSAAPEPGDPLEQSAQAPPADDAIAAWFLSDVERVNRATDLRAFSAGNAVTPLVDGASYFRRLCTELAATVAGDQVYFLEFRGDLDERLDGKGTEVGEVLASAAARGVAVFGLLWRSQPNAFDQSEEQNAAFVRHIDEHGGQVLLDARTRRAGSHHQKLVVIRHPGRSDQDVAFVGGIDLGRSRNDDHHHRGDPQVMDFPSSYGPRPPWHDIQAEVRGPAVHDLEHTFRERWYGSNLLDIPSPFRQLYDRAYHMGATTARPLPDPLPADDTPRGTHAVQVLRTYPARVRRYPFAPLGERSIAAAYRKAFARARRLVYIEDQYLWSRRVADTILGAMTRNRDLQVVVVVPRFPDHDSTATKAPALLARQEAISVITAAVGSRFAVLDLENHAGTAVYVHAKVVIVDDVWAMVGSDNLNRRSWTHDSELSIAVLDAEHDTREPAEPADSVDGARVFARDLRLQLWREHLDREPDQDDDLLDPVEAVRAFVHQAAVLEEWYAGGQVGQRPPGRVRPHRPTEVGRLTRLWAKPFYLSVYDPDGRPWRDRIRGRG